VIWINTELDGMSDSQVRAVSYGKADDRQVRKGKWGNGAEPNRRAARVVDLPVRRRRRDVMRGVP